MSSLLITVERIKQVKPHPNADKLDIVVVNGWETIVSKGQYKVGNLVTFVPPESIVPTDLADQMGFRQYLRGVNHDRVGIIKLRGVMSYGLLLPVPVDENDYPFTEGADVAKDWGITKYEPPIHPVQGEPRPKDPSFPEWFEIENIRHYPNIFSPDEEVYGTEKIDGRNCRIGVEIVQAGADSITPYALKAGSHRVNRDNPGRENWSTNCYWFPFTIPQIMNAITSFVECYFDEPGRSLIIYGEVYGAAYGGLKEMGYGCPNELQFRAFGAQINGNWMKPTVFRPFCQLWGIPYAPVLWHCKYGDIRSLSEVEDLFALSSVVASENKTQQIMEGIVIQSAVNPAKIVKLLNPAYLLLKQKKEDKGEQFDATDV